MKPLSPAPIALAQDDAPEHETGGAGFQLEPQ